MYFLNGKYMTEEPLMGDVASDPIALELLRVQRGRLADRLRPPWWYLAGVGIMFALVFAYPFASRFLGVSIWPFLVAALAVAVALQWGWTRVTGIKMRFRNLSSPAPGRLARYAVAVASVGGIVTVHFLIDRGLIAAAIAVAALAVTAEVALQLVLLRGIRQELRDGGAPA
jgi:hypothetical protein